MDLHEELERITDDIMHIEDAIEALQDVADCDDVIDVLHDRMLVLGVRRDDVHARIEAIDAREEAELTREYWRAVI